MEQFEKVCKGLVFCIRNPRGVCAKECPYKMLCFYTEGETIKNRLMSDALSLIRQQQERIEELEAGQKQEPALLENQHKPYGHFINANSSWISRCPNCGKKVEGKQTRYCKYCGQAVKWE